MSSLSSAKHSSSKRSSKGNLIQNTNKNNLTSQVQNQNRYILQKQKSAHNSIASSKKKFSTTQKNKFSTSQITSSHQPYNHSNNLITFQKTQQKLKKNLMKQFQTFNHNQHDSNQYLRNYQQVNQVQKSQKSSRSKSKKKSANIYSQSNSFKEKGSKNKQYQLQQTTSHKSPAQRILKRSKKNSKTQLSHYPNNKNPIKLSFSKQKQTILKSAMASGDQSNQNSFTIKSRSKSPIQAQQQKLKRSRNSSPDVGRVYNNSKTQNYKDASKRGVYSKMEYYQHNINQKQQQKQQKNDNKPISHYKKTPQKIHLNLQTAKNPPRFNNHSTSQTKPSSKTKTSHQQPHFQQQPQIQSSLNIINFPHMITESQSIYPSSSYPNTGKQSQNYYDTRNMNRNIEEEEEEGQEYQEDLKIDDEGYMVDVDYISEQGNGDQKFQGEQFSSSNQSKRSSNKRLKHTDYQVQKQFQIKFKTSKGFIKDPSTTFNNYRAENLPKSYIIAMQTLQNKVEQQSNFIKRLKKSLNLKNQSQIQTNQQIINLTTKLQQKQQIIIKKDIQINFLKGYLDQVKQNNRQALKQVAKNVYHKVIEHNTPSKINQNSSIIKRQRINSQQQQTSSTNIKTNKQNKRLFNNENKQTSSKRDMTNTDIKVRDQNQNYLSEQQQQLEINLNKNQIQLPQDKITADNQAPINQPQAQRNSKSHNRQFQFQQSFSLKSPQPKPQQNTSSIVKKTQKKQQVLTNRSKKQKQPHLPKNNQSQQHHTKSKSIIDQIHPSGSQNNTQKKIILKRKYDYTNQSQNRDQYLYENNKIQPKNVIMNREDREVVVSSEGKRFRVNSERIQNSYNDHGYDNNSGGGRKVYFGENSQPQLLNRNFSHSFLKSQRKPIANSSLHNNKPELLDPVLQKYIQSKSLYQLGYSPHINSKNPQTFSISHQPTYQNQQLLFIDPRQKNLMMSKHRDKISKMRDLIRSQKQLVTLNYQMESLQNKILNQVKKIQNKQKESDRKHLIDSGKDVGTNRSGYNLDSLQYQYNLIKKQFQRKQAEIRRLQIQLDEDGR